MSVLALSGMGRRWWSGVVVGLAAAILLGGGVLIGLTAGHHSPAALSQPNHALVVPALVGEPLSVASNALGQAGLVGTLEAAPPTGNGVVLVASQSPPAGAHVKEGTSVTFTLAVK
jgi:PASTA domain